MGAGWQAPTRRVRAGRAITVTTCAVALAGAGCVQGLTQIAGVGATYHTRCSADMIAEDGVYRARCTPEGCAQGFTEGPVSHVVVALDPGRKIVGYAERICLQDLSDAGALFTPPVQEPREAPAPPAAEAEPAPSTTP